MYLFINYINIMMKQKTKYLLVFIIPILLIVFLSMIAMSSIYNSKQETIKIGAITPLTGDASVYGDPAGKAILLAEEQINKQGGILGKKLEIILEDGKCDSKETLNAVNKLIFIDKTKIILGGHCSTESLTIAPVANQNKIIQLATITSSDKFTEAGDYSFRNWPSSDYYVSKLGDIAIQKGAKKIAILYEQKDFPQSAMKSFKKRFIELGGEVVIEQSFLPEETDFKDYLTKIKDKKEVDSIFFSTQGGGNAEIYFKQLKEFGMIGKYLMFTNNDPVSKKVYDDTGGLNKNVFTTDVYVNPTRKKTKDLLELYKEKYGDYPKTNNFHVACSYDTVFIIKDALEHCGKVDPECIKNYLYNLKNLQGPAGSVTFDNNGDAITTIGLHYFDEKGNEVWKELN